MPLQSRGFSGSGMTLIDGKAIAQKINDQTRIEVALLKTKGITPGLAVVVVGDDPASHAYVRSKEKTARELVFAPLGMAQSSYVGGAGVPTGAMPARTLLGIAGAPWFAVTFIMLILGVGVLRWRRGEWAVPLGLVAIAGATGTAAVLVLIGAFMGAPALPTVGGIAILLSAGALAGVRDRRIELGAAQLGRLPVREPLRESRRRMGDGQAPRAVHDVLALFRRLAQAGDAQHAAGEFPAPAGPRADGDLPHLPELLLRAVPLSEPGNRQDPAQAQSGGGRSGQHGRLRRARKLRWRVPR